MGALLLALNGLALHAQTSLSWFEVKQRFEASNPTLRAARLSIDESRAAEITAYLRPNPDYTLSTDGTQLSKYQGVWRPFAGTQIFNGVSYLHEREHKRELRRDSAVAATAIVESQSLDLERSLLFNLRTAFVGVLQAKAILRNAEDNLSYWDKELEVMRIRYKAGDMALVDLNRLELQRVQFEADFENATVSLRTSKIQLLTLLNDRTPIAKFDVKGAFDFTEGLPNLEEFRMAAIATRPDLKASLESVEMAKLSHKLAVANSSADPTYSFWITHNPSFNNPYDNNTIGASVTIPLRLFDRNQGEKARTQIDISRNEKLRDSARASVLSDVDSAYYTLAQALNLLRPYKMKYLPLALDVRDRLAVSYKNGGASLLDLLDAEKAYRDTRLAYLNLIGSYLTTAAQMNLAVGREVL